MLKLLLDYGSHYKTHVATVRTYLWNRWLYASASTNEQSETTKGAFLTVKMIGSEKTPWEKFEIGTPI